MKKTKFLFTLIAATCVMQAMAQTNAIDQIIDPANASIDYMPAIDAYALSGTVHPVSIGGMSNAAPFGYLPRIQLQVVDNSTLTTNWYKTYCTGLEVSDVADSRCSTLSTGFIQSDARQTADKGFILCGYVTRTSEYTSCTGGPTFTNPYLIKVDASGNPVWFMRYDINYNNGTRFTSVIEDPQTGNFVVCGGTVPNATDPPTGFIMGTDNMGNVLWAHNVTTTQYGTTTLNSSYYSRITTYGQGHQQFLALTGPVGYSLYYGYGVNTGGGFLTLIDGWGNFFRNVYITEDAYARFMQTDGITDAHDGDLVLTGFSGGNNCGAHDGFNLMIMKINPWALSTTFMKVYQTNPSYMYDVSSGTSVAVSTNAAGSGNIEITGMENNGIHGAPDNGIYAETDYNGSLLRYVPHNSANMLDGVGIILNTTNNYTAYTGSFMGGTTLIKNRYGVDCEPNAPAIVSSLSNSTVNNNVTIPNILTIPDNLLAYSLTPNESIVCGALKPAKNGPANATTDHVVVAPNPAESNVDVKLPETLINGTINVYDMTGRLVLSGQPNAGHTLHLDVSALTNGVYMLTAENNGTKEHTTFVKQ